MKSNKFDNKILIRIDKGEEIITSLIEICKEHAVRLGTVSGIGATNKVKIGLFDVDSKKYHATEFMDNYEIAPLTGNISTMNNEIYIHAHINICDVQHRSFGGHLNSAIVSATFEGVIDIINGKVDRKFDKKIGLNLLKI